MKMRSKIIVMAALACGGAVLARDAIETGSQSVGDVRVRLVDALNRGVGVEPLAREWLSPALAALITQSRDAAIERGVAAMPVEIRAALEEFLPADVLDRVRWRVDGDTGLVGRLLLGSGTARAVTLDHVIVFANAEEAANVKLWAHELCHVLQYRRWGVAGFAERFVDDHKAIEHEAREFRWSFMKATGRVPQV